MRRKADNKPLTKTALIKETCRQIRVARAYWDAHNCRGEPEKALAFHESLGVELAIDAFLDAPFNQK